MLAIPADLGVADFCAFLGGYLRAVRAAAVHPAFRNDIVAEPCLSQPGTLLMVLLTHDCPDLPLLSRMREIFMVQNTSGPSV